MSHRVDNRLPQNLGELFQGIAQIPADLSRLPVSRLVLDSKSLRTDDLFVAVPGRNRHGVAYYGEAARSGAKAVLFEPPCESLPQGDVPLIPVEALRAHLPELARRLSGAATDSLWTVGVTGTDGKTSVTFFLAQALNVGKTRMGFLGTLGNGYPGSLCPSAHTTSDVLNLHREMKRFRDEGAEGIVMEVSSHALDQNRVGGLAFDVAVLTQLGRDHLDYHGSPEAYAQAKRRLFYWPGLHWRVINADDPFGRSLLAKPAEDVTDLAYGLNPMLVRGAADHQLFATAIHPHLQGMDVAFDGTWGRGLLRTPLMGRFNVENLLAAFAVLLIHGVPFKQAVKRIEAVTTAPGRMEHFGGEGAPHVIVDYAHTPGALKSAITAIRAHTETRLITVFGCGGDRDKGKRPLMGQVAAELSDAVWLTNDNPRTEDPRQIIKNIADGIPAEFADNLRIEADRRRAIFDAIEFAGPRDIVLIAGKGHEDVQIIGDERLPYSDLETVRSCLGGALQ